ncbi:unnamed protein product [Penicillium salamii]|nr:unnamed protein product [Penicillium salamii]CAG8080879.1 unnamed protein product [Penicillium salamii]CAG8374845.1 unnamed protein product [Penicillium salamii]
MSSVHQPIVLILVPISTFFLSVGAFFHLANIPYPRRVFLSPLLYIPAGVSFATSNWWPGDLNSLWGLLLCIWVGHSTSLLFIEDLGVWEDGDYIGRISKLAPHIPGKHHKGLKLWNNPLLLGTSYQIANKSKSATSFPSSLARFTVLRLGKLVTYVGMYLYIKSRIFPAVFMPLRMDEFDPLHQVYFRRLPSQIVPVTLRETLLRCAFVCWWTFSAVAMLDSAHAALSLVSVSLFRIDEPYEWPSIFGSLSQAWSIRRFWSKFWHQIVRRTYTNYGECISRNILRLQPRSVPDKVFVIFMIFFLSGVSHAAVSWQLGDHCGWSLDIWWFCANFFAGLLEVVVTQLFRACVKKLGFKRLDESNWSKVVGFIWVFSFMFWSIPKWQYPKLYCHLSDA